MFTVFGAGYDRTYPPTFFSRTIGPTRRPFFFPSMCGTIFFTVKKLQFSLNRHELHRILIHYQIHFYWILGACSKTTAIHIMVALFAALGALLLLPLFMSAKSHPTSRSSIPKQGDHGRRNAQVFHVVLDEIICEDCFLCLFR